MISNKKHKSSDFYGKSFPRPTFLVQSGEVVRDRTDAPLPPNAGLMAWAQKTSYREGGLKPSWHGKQPRLPLRPFHAFVALKRQQALEEHPELKFDAKGLKLAATRQAALDWAAFSEDQKRVFVEHAEADKARYAKEVAEFERSNPGYSAWAAEHHTFTAKGFGAPRAKMDKPDKPKRALEFFVKDKLERAKASDPDLGKDKTELALYSEYVTKYLDVWNRMAENSGPKRKFKRQERDDAKRYEEELAQPRYAEYRAHLAEKAAAKQKTAANKGDKAAAVATRSAAKPRAAGARKLAKAKASLVARRKAVRARCGKENSLGQAKRVQTEVAAAAAQDTGKDASAEESEATEGVPESQLVSRVPESQYDDWEHNSDEEDEEEDAEDYEEGDEDEEMEAADAADDAALQNAEEETDDDSEGGESEDDDEECDEILNLADPDDIRSTQEAAAAGVLGALTHGWRSVMKGTTRGVRRFLTGRTGDTPPKGSGRARLAPAMEDAAEQLPAGSPPAAAAAPGTASRQSTHRTAPQQSTPAAIPTRDREAQIAEGKSYLGRRVAKEFIRDDGSEQPDVFEGTVVEFDPALDDSDIDLWHIRYDDDDSETVGERELKRILLPTKGPVSAAAPGQPAPTDQRRVTFGSAASQSPPPTAPKASADAPAPASQPLPTRSGKTPSKGTKDEMQEETPGTREARTPGRAALAAKAASRKRKALLALQ